MAHLDRRSVQRRATAKQWDNDALSSAARSYANGNSLAHSADEFDIDPSTIANRLRKLAYRSGPARMNLNSHSEPVISTTTRATVPAL
jgi:hypothetical protein